MTFFRRLAIGLLIPVAILYGVFLVPALAPIGRLLRRLAEPLKGPLR